MYHVQFLVDGSWMTSPELPVGDDEDGHLCNTARPAPSLGSGVTPAQPIHAAQVYASLSQTSPNAVAGQRAVATGFPRVLRHRLAAADAALQGPSRGWRAARRCGCCLLSAIP